jgi:DNA-binding CsgD family transcriptional regulator
LVGRRRERDAVAAALDDARRGLAAILITGDPGIGKTELLRQAAEQAREAGFRVLSAAGGEVERELPYAALVDLLGGLGDDATSALPEFQRQVLDVVLLRGDAAGPLEPRAVALAVLGALEEVAGHEPTALVFDDLHWTDAASGHALSFALRRLQASPLAIIGTKRPRVRSPLDLRAILSSERLRDVLMGPLDPDTLAEVLAGRLGHRPSVPVLHRILELSAGNPLVGLELGRAAQDDPGLLSTLDAQRLPERLRRLIGSRLARLSPHQRRAMAEVAAMSRPTDALITEMGIPREVIRAARDAGVVRETDDHWDFTHPLVRSAAASLLTPSERRALNARLAGVVTDEVARAGHVAHSADGPEEAAAALVEAGARRAAYRGAPMEAALLAERAVELTEPAAKNPWFERMLLAARLRHQAGDNPNAQRLLSAAIAGAPPDRRARAILELARVEMFTSGMAAITRLRAALRDSVNDGTRAEIHLELADGLRLSERLPVARRHARLAVGCAERVDDGRLLAQALSIAGLLAFNATGRVDDDLIDRVLRLEKPMPAHPWLETRAAALNMGHILVWAGRFGRARDVLEAIDPSSPAANPDANQGALWYLAVADFWTGRWSEAETRISTLVRVSETRGEANDSILILGALVAAHRGDPAAPALAEGARRAAALARSDRFMAFADYVLGFWSLSQGDAAAAVSHLERSLEVERRIGVVVPGATFTVPESIEALAMAGRVSEAKQLAAAFALRQRRWQATMFRAGVARALAILAMAEGDLHRAAHILKPWLEPEPLAQLPFLRARAQLVSGRLLRRRRHRAQAREAIVRARETFEALGARLWAAQADAELRRIGDRPGSGRELTPTEARIAELAVGGRTNREIAENLFLSVKTVEWNLTRVYGKLQVRSRAQLAARFAADGPPSEDAGRPRPVR